eukprot:jgi/Chlat1/5893/Chrsp4S06243
MEVHSMSHYVPVAPMAADASLRLSPVKKKRKFDIHVRVDPELQQGWLHWTVGSNYACPLPFTNATALIRWLAGGGLNAFVTHQIQANNHLYGALSRQQFANAQLQTDVAFTKQQVEHWQQQDALARTEMAEVERKFTAAAEKLSTLQQELKEAQKLAAARQSRKDFSQLSKRGRAYATVHIKDTLVPGWRSLSDADRAEAFGIAFAMLIKTKEMKWALGHSKYLEVIRALKSDGLNSMFDHVDINDICMVLDTTRGEQSYDGLYKLLAQASSVAGLNMRLRSKDDKVSVNTWQLVQDRRHTNDQTTAIPIVDTAINNGKQLELVRMLDLSIRLHNLQPDVHSPLQICFYLDETTEYNDRKIQRICF